MKIKLEDIAKIYVGQYLKPKDSGAAKYLLASHFNKQCQPTEFEHSYVDIDEKLQNELLQHNDVILASKGRRFFAWSYDNEMGKCIPSSIFIVMRVDKSKVLGEYLSYYLNSDIVQHKLAILGGGVTVPAIPKSELQKMSVYIPSLKAQKEFIKLADLLEEDVSLSEQLLEKKLKMKNSIINRLINENKIG